jgi:hypothetical protein
MVMQHEQVHLMPRDIEWPEQLAPGDVLMVARDMVDKRTKKPFVWRFFMVVLEHRRTRETVRGLIVGANEEKEEITIGIGKADNRNEVQFLEPDEWPDGVCASRMMLALEGKIEGLV